jgi:ankyrin repeat protein
MERNTSYTIVVGLLTVLFLAGCGKSTFQKNEDLQNAAKAGDLKGVMAAIKEGAEINFQDYYGRTALIYAAEKGHLDVVKYLVDKGAKVNLQDYTSGTALIVATANGHKEVVTFLLEHGANPDIKGITGSARDVVNPNDTLLIRTLVKPK